MRTRLNDHHCDTSNTDILHSFWPFIKVNKIQPKNKMYYMTNKISFCHLQNMEQIKKLYDIQRDKQ